MEKQALTFRYATAADNTLLAEFGAQMFTAAFAAQNTPENMAAYLAKAFDPGKQAAEIADPAGVFLIAEIGDEVVGYARLRQGTPLAGVTGEKPVEIVRFYARPDYIGKGVGPGLMQACLDQAQKWSCDVIWLDVWEENPRARAFYSKWGFVEVGEAVFPLGDDLQHDLLMQRKVVME